MNGRVDRLTVHPTCTEIVIDGAVYSVEAIKEVLCNNLLRRHVIDGRVYTEECLKSLIDRAWDEEHQKKGVKPNGVVDTEETESSVQRLARELAERDAATKEEILRAFVAKHGLQPDECEIVQNGMLWFVRLRSDILDMQKREKAVEEDRKQLGKLITFFNTAIAARFAEYGDDMGYTPVETAIHWLTQFAQRESAALPRAERTEHVENQLRELGFDNIADLVSGYRLVERAVAELQQEKLL